MEIVRLHTVSVHIRPDSYLIIPVPIEMGDTVGLIGDDTEGAPRYGSLTSAQGDVLYRHAVPHMGVTEQVRALAHGAFTNADLGEDEEDELPRYNETVSSCKQREFRCTGGRVYWW